jgi:hypothetical protein
MGLRSGLELHYWELKQEGNLSHSPVSADKIFCSGEVTTVQPNMTVFNELFDTMLTWWTKRFILNIFFICLIVWEPRSTCCYWNLRPKNWKLTQERWSPYRLKLPGLLFHLKLVRLKCSLFAWLSNFFTPNKLRRKK